MLLFVTSLNLVAVTDLPVREPLLHDGKSSNIFYHDI